MNPGSAASPATATSLPIFVVATVSAVLLPLTLVHTLPAEGLSLGNLFLMCFMPVTLYVMWISTFEVSIQQTQIVVKRLFGLITPVVIPSGSIYEFRAKSNSNGQLTRFEIIVDGRRAVQLHMFQQNFLAAATALRAFNPSVSEHALSPWAL